MNGTVYDGYTLRLTQSAKGFFYIDKIEVNGEDMGKVLEDMKKYASATVVLLESLNSGKIDRTMIKET